MEFKRGDTVEISIKEDGFQGSYYPATLLSRVGKSQFLIEYKTLFTEQDECRLLREIVDATNVRPSPPEIEVSEFSILDKVDVYANDGWWIGRISAIVDSSKSKYYVYFPSSGDEIGYPVSQLRIHQEVEDGKWVVSKYKKGFK